MSCLYFGCRRNVTRTFERNQSAVDSRRFKVKDDIIYVVSNSTNQLFYRRKWKSRCFIFICDALRNLVTFVDFKKREKHPWRSVDFNKVTTHRICF